MCNILFKTYITTRFFKSSFLKPLQKESFTINIEHYKVFEETILNAVSTPIPASGNKNIIIYLEQANSDLNPFLLIHDPLIRGLFSINIINAWFFGGRQNPILILQYLIPEVFYFTKTSEWNRLLTNLTGKYPSLKLHLFEVTKERRFYNEQSIFSLNPRHLEYLTLTFPKKIDENYSNPYELVYNFEEQQLSLDSDGINKKFQENRSLTESEMEILCRKKVIYTPTYFSWQFFQLIQYPVLVFIKIHSVPEVKYQRLIALFEQLPIGHIFEITNLENGDKDLSVFLQLRDNIPRFFQRMIGILDLQKLAYYITPVLTLDLYQDSAFAKILAISRKKFKFRTARGELLEIPIFLWHQRHSTYSPQDQITIYESLYEIYPKIKAQLTHQNWKSILKRISELYNTEDFTEQGIIREISGLFSIE